MSEGDELLFFDTFAHANNEELNLDLVQFPKPVYLSQVRVVPLGARVQANFPGGVRLGATNPSQFKLELFVNDLSKPGASAFETLGTLEYNQNATIHFDCEKKVPTDGLVLRGWYTTVTLAVYGSISVGAIMTEPPPRSTPEQPPTPVTAEPVFAEEKPSLGSTNQEKSSTPVPTVAEPAIPKPEPVTPGDVKPKEETSKEKVKEEEVTQKESATVEHEKPVQELKKDRSTKEKTVGKEKESSREKDKKRDEKRKVDDKPKSRDSDVRDGEPEARESTEVRSRDRDRDRRKEREARERSRDRDYDKYRERSRSDRERSRESARRPRSPPVTPPPKETAVDTEVKKEEKEVVKVVSPGETEAISDDDMPEVDNALIAQNVGSVEAESNEEDVKYEPTEDKQEKLADFSSSAPEAAMDVDAEAEREELEEILSDEDIAFEEEYAEDIDMSEFGEEIGKPFNPYSFEVRPLQYLSDPSASISENVLRRVKANSSADLKEGLEALRYLDETLSLPSRGEKWVEAVEQVSKILPSAVAYHAYSSSATEGFYPTLVEWLFHGLDFESALSQSQPVFIVRHLKAGLKLTSAFAQTTEDLVRSAVDKGVLNKLLFLYNAPHMALSLRLMCLRSLDTVLSCPFAVEHFITNPASNEKNGYGFLVGLLSKPQPTRAKVSIVAILKKLHTFEALQKIQSIAKSIAEAPVPVFRKAVIRRSSALSLGSQDSSSQDTLMQTVAKENPLEPHLTELVACLTELSKTCRKPQVSVGQFARFLPVKSQFEVPAAEDASQALYSYMKHSKFLCVVALLLTHVSSSADSSLTSLLIDFVEDLMQTNNGLLFLSANKEATSLLLKVFFHTAASPSAEEESHMEDLPQPSPTSAYNKIGSRLAHSLQIIQHLDVLSREMSCAQRDMAVCTEILRQLFTFVFSVAGKESLVHVLSMDSNMGRLVDVLRSQDMEVRNSAARGYAAEIVSLVIQFSDKVACYRKYGAVLSSVLEHDKESRLGALEPWLELAVNPVVFTHDGIATLCEVAKQHADDAHQAPPTLAVALRLLRSLAVASDEPNTNDEDCVELKYFYSIMQMFSNDLLSTLTNALSKLCQEYEHPSLHTAALASSKGALLMNIIHPSLSLIRVILSHLIRCRDNEFHDLTAIPVLLQSYVLLNAVPRTSFAYRHIEECQSNIISTLLAYTQPVLQPQKSTGSTLSSAEDALARSLWTQMIQELFKFALKSTGPGSYVCVLQILGELLPLPLPVLYSVRLNETGKHTDDDIQHVLKARKLWSIHLHSLSSQIHEMISIMSCSGPQVFQLLRRVCIQIADLSATTALLVVRSSLDALMSSLTPEADGKVDVVPPATIVCSVTAYRTLNFLTSLVSHPPVKAALLQLCRDSQKADDKYADLLQWLCVLLNTASSVSVHIQAQECVVLLFQTLLDVDVCLLPSDTDHDVCLSAALPSREHIQQLMYGLLDHLSNGEHSYSSLLPALRTLTMLTEHNYTFQILQKVLDKKRTALKGLFTKFVSGFSKDSSDCLSTLSTSFEFVRLLVKPAEGLHLRNPRHLCMSVSALASALQWNQSESANSEISSNSKHSLVILSELLKRHSAEDESVESLRDNLNGLLDILRENPPSKGKTDTPDINLPVADSLTAQFSSRSVFAATSSEDERLSASYWLLPLWTEEADLVSENVRTDLAEICKKYLGDLDLAAEMTRLSTAHVVPAPGVEKHSSARVKISSKGSITNGAAPNDQPLQAIISTVKDKSNKPYVAPMRGRGFGRGGMITRNDPFRSRVPNTSRPPSMHVDDFVALENSGGSSGAPYNKTREGNLPPRGRGARARGFAADRSRYTFVARQDPMRPGRPAGPWEDYFPPDERDGRLSGRFPMSGRPWPGSKERYGVPSSNAARNRHSRTFTR